MSAAYCCEACGATEPHWYIMRTGDAAVTWACDDHLVAVLTGLQRGGEVTEFTVWDSRRKRAQVRRARENLERLARERPQK
jgi:hypothetical protein